MNSHGTCCSKNFFGEKYSHTTLVDKLRME
jgi:hypothetical protein